MRRRLIAASTALLLCSTLHGQARRPLAIEDYYNVATITNPQISPDGKSVRFSVQTRVESDNSSKTQTFTVPTDGSAPPTRIAGSAEDGRGGRGAGGRGAGLSSATSPD